jgi:hypothetical protein
MGHLAERYCDPSRSGVYRVTDAAIPRAAAREAGPGPEILILEGLDRLAAPEVKALVALLDSMAQARRARGTPFFAVLVDPKKALDLPNLYKEKT